MSKFIKRTDIDGTKYNISEEDTVPNVKIKKPKDYKTPEKLFSEKDYSKNKPLSRKELKNLANELSNKLVNLEQNGEI